MTDNMHSSSMPIIPSTSKCFATASSSSSVEVKGNNESIMAMCDICGRGFSNESYVNRHKRNVHFKKSVADEHKKCSKCRRTFTDMRKFWQHVVLVHEMKEDGDDEEDEGQGGPPKEPEPRLDPRVNTVWKSSARSEATCKECGKEFANVKEVKKHIMNIHLKMKCGKKLRDQHNMNRHMKDVHSLSKTDFPCNQCSIVLCSADGLIRHKKNVHLVKEEPIPNGSPPTQCPYCSEIFCHQGYEAHIRELHSEHYEEYVNANSLQMGPGGSKHPSTCPVCGDTFSDGQILQRHITRVHGNLTCSACGKCFGDQKELRNHWMSHQNSILEPHVKAMLKTVYGTVCNSNMTCGICQTVVYSSLEAKLHLYIKHPDTFHQMVTKEVAGAGLLCTVCSEGQETKKQLIEHMELYHPDKNLPSCGVCGHKELKERAMYHHHKRYHSQAPRYICNVCQAPFTQKIGLKHHMKREHSDNADQCPFCSEKHVKVKLHVTKKHPERAVEYGKLVERAIKEEREARTRFNQFLDGKNFKTGRRRIDREDAESNGDNEDEFNQDEEEHEIEKKPIPSDCGVALQPRSVMPEKYKIEKNAEQPHVIEIQRIAQPEPDQIFPDDEQDEEEEDVKPNLQLLNADLNLNSLQENEEGDQYLAQDDEDYIYINLPQNEDYRVNVDQAQHEDDVEIHADDDDDIDHAYRLFMGPPRRNGMPNHQMMEQFLRDVNEDTPRTIKVKLCKRTLAIEVDRLTESEISKWTKSSTESSTSVAASSKKVGQKTSKKRRKRRY